ncbi:F0F1 ATP synthase subunit gamma [Hyphomonas sp. WL0036]|uniref:F0F1 ATP synthase subunit gamma n=1 Tax=Hyphomonas sediminis TaxID=2866160 RepID=UPI001C820F71|nr:F0F1 ATP synthase subunit gamma [Hyphomonas sediminis]MBY9067712.1 F0F1 ATP synthase subunit gamma [Hyphomonas sediminis]
MPSLKDLKNRIGSVKSTQKITKAMQLVAAAKLKRAQDAATAARPYAERLASVLANLAATTGQGGPKLLTGNGNDQTHLIVVMTAERGLAGGFNAYVAKLARQKIMQLQSEGKTVKVVTIGKKGREVLAREFGGLFTSHISLADVKGNNFADPALSVGQMLTQGFENGEFDVATLIYSHFKNVLAQVPTAQQLIPAKAPEGAATIDLGGAQYRYEPSEEAILEALLPRYINTQILSAMLESSAGEQASRMTAMDNATRNAKDLIKSLNLKYNRARQAQITKELIEIISGAEAL